jgi:hypothetical protein
VANVFLAFRGAPERAAFHSFNVELRQKLEIKKLERLSISGLLSDYRTTKRCAPVPE